MAWWKEVLNLLKKVPKVISKGFIKGTVTEVSMDNVISLASKAGKTVTSVTNDLGQCVGFGTVSSTSVNGATAEVIELFEVTTTEVAAEAGAATLAGESLAAGEVATEVALAETGVGVGATALSVAGVAILAALGCYLIYQEDPEFWNGVGEKLMYAGDTMAHKVITFFTEDGESYYNQSTIDIIKEEAIKAQLLSSDSVNMVNTIYETGDYIYKESTSPTWGYGAKYFDTIYTNVDDTTGTEPQCTSPFNYIIIYSENGYVVYQAINATGDYEYARDRMYGVGYVISNGTNILELFPCLSVSGRTFADFLAANQHILSKILLAMDYNFDYDYDNFNTAQERDENRCKIIAYNFFNSLEIPKPPQVNPLPEPIELPDALPAKKRTVYPIEIPSQLDETSKDSDFDTRPDKEKPTISDDPNNASDKDSDTGKITNPVPNPVPAPAPQPEIPDPNETKNNDKGKTPVIVPELPVTASAVSRVFNLSQSELDSLGAYLWSSTSIDDLKKLFQSPLDGVISLHKIYGTPTTGERRNIKLGYIDTNVSALEVTSQFITIDCGTVTVPLQYNNATDYPPYTDVQIYLPFIGIQSLNAYDIINSQLACKYRIDVYTGACIAMLTVIRGNMSAKLYEFAGSCCYQLPLTSGNYMQLLANTVTGAVVGGAKGGLGGAIMGGAGAMLHSNVDIARSGNLSQNAGILGSREPYLIITRTDAYDAADYNTLYGYPCNKTVYLKNCKGYTRVKDIKLHTSATQEEKDEIEKLLKGGVII